MMAKLSIISIQLNRVADIYARLKDITSKYDLSYWNNIMYTCRKYRFNLLIQHTDCVSCKLNCYISLWNLCSLAMVGRLLQHVFINVFVSYICRESYYFRWLDKFRSPNLKLVEVSFSVTLARSCLEKPTTLDIVFCNFPTFLKSLDSPQSGTWYLK